MLASFVAVTLLTSVLLSSADACTCFHQPIHSSLCSADRLWKVHVVDEVDQGIDFNDLNNQMHLRKYRVKVIYVFKGEDMPEGKELIIHSAAHDALCGTQLPEDTVMLLAPKTYNNQFHIGVCDLARMWDYELDDNLKVDLELDNLDCDCQPAHPYAPSPCCGTFDDVWSVSSCMSSHGRCSKQGDVCQWEKSNEFEECLNDVGFTLGDELCVAQKPCPKYATFKEYQRSTQPTCLNARVEKVYPRGMCVCPKDKPYLDETTDTCVADRDCPLVAPPPEPTEEEPAAGAMTSGEPVECPSNQVFYEKGQCLPCLETCGSTVIFCPRVCVSEACGCPKDKPILGLLTCYSRTDCKTANEVEEPDELKEEITWCSYSNMFLSEYSAGKYSYKTLEEAQLECLKRNDCGGVTQNSTNQVFTLRKGPALNKSPYNETSWKLCDQKKVPITEGVTTEGATTEEPTTEGATTEGPTTEDATTEGATTAEPSTESVTKEVTDKMTEITWCSYSNMFLSEFSAGKYSYKTLEEAQLECLKRNDCGGVTQNSNNQVFTLRKGPTLKKSPYNETSWKLCDQKKGTEDLSTGEMVLTKCLQEKKDVEGQIVLIDGQKIPLLGAHGPDCDEEGNYLPKQCKEAGCYCVNEDGEMINGTYWDKYNESGLDFECDFSGVVCSMTDHVFYECAPFKKICGLAEFPAIEGMCVPGCRCPEEKSWNQENMCVAQEQCKEADPYEKLLQKFVPQVKPVNTTKVDPECVDKDNNCKAWAARKLCDNAYLIKNCKVSCQLCPMLSMELQPTCMDYKNALNKETGMMFGRPSVDCNEGGSFFPKQCLGGVCYCVDENGVMEEGTAHQRGHNLQCSRYPECPGGMEYTQCVTMKKICGEDEGDDAMKEDCEAGCTCPMDKMFYDETKEMCVSECPKGSLIPIVVGEACNEAREKITSANTKDGRPILFGAFVPECEDNGDYYAAQQCHGSVCYCVDEEGNVDMKTKHARGSDYVCQRTLDSCTGGKEYNLCGSSCPSTCDNMFQLLACNLMCNIGCQCPDGTVENNGTCVNPMQCPNYNTDLPENCAQRVIAMERLGLKKMPGAHIPVCNEEGEYTFTQCIGSECYCVHPKSGEELEGSRHAQEKDFDCAKAVMDASCENNKVWWHCGSACESTCEKPTQICTKQCVPKCQCPRDKPIWDEDQKMCITQDECPKPTCENGMVYKECGSVCNRTCANIQPACHSVMAHDSVNVTRNSSNCVAQCECPSDTLLDEETGSCVQPRDCTELNLSSLPAKCALRDAAIDSLQLPPGAPSVECDASGDYLSEQCQGALCYCVDKMTGVKKEMTQHPRGQVYDCDREPSKCEIERLVGQKEGEFGNFIPSCAEDGSYSPSQCHGSECFCVNMEGDEIRDSVHGRGDVHDCDLRRTMVMTEKCYKQREMSESNEKSVGQHVPECTADGMYAPVQCIGSECSCVDEYGQNFGELFGRGDNNTCEEQREARQQSHPCLSSRRAKHLMSSKGQIGGFSPVCDEMGDYAPTQCTGSRCYCVDPLGRKVSEDTFLRGDSVGSEACILKRAFMMQQTCYKEYLSAPKNDTDMMFGSFVPNCNPRGLYDVYQCVGMECYCTDDLGRKINDTNFVKGEVNNCADKVSEVLSSECNLARKAAMDKSELGEVGQFFPECLVDGTYDVRQCFGAVCYCSDSEGRELSNSNHPIGSYDHDCQERRDRFESSACYKQKQEAASFIGGFVPMCDQDGNYEARQCQGSKCYCVDSSGKKINGTEAHIGERQSCETVRLMVESSACFVEQKSVDKMIGVFSPDCSIKDGSYAPRQCHGSVCYCVTKSGDKINGTEQGRGEENRCVEEGERVPSCSQAREAMLKLAGGDPIVGLPNVLCTEDGKYFPQQCLGTNCSCVDAFGRNVEGSQHHVSDQSKCMMMLNKGGKMLASPVKRCDNARKDAQRNGFIGVYVPECVYEEYHPRQCFGSVCFCVDENGQRKSGTEHPIGEERDCFDPIFHMRIPEMIEVGEGSSVTCSITAGKEDDTFVMMVNGVRYDELKKDSWNEAQFERNVYKEDNGTINTAIEGFVDRFKMDQNGSRVECLSKMYDRTETRVVMLNGTHVSMCPDDVPVVKCFVNPCDTATCARYVEAECEPNYCGTCSAKFYFNGNLVEDCDVEEEKVEVAKPVMRYYRIYNQKRGYVTVGDKASDPVTVNSKKVDGNSQLFQFKDSILRSVMFDDQCLSQKLTSNGITVILKANKGSKMQNWFEDKDKLGSGRLYVNRPTKKGSKKSYLDYYKKALTGYTGTDKANQRWSLVPEEV